MKNNNSCNHNLSWAHCTVEVFYKLGIHHVCISPGARNSPLTYAFSEHPSIASYIHIDERSAGFFGLGLAKYSANPVILISTSGTAPANYYPAVIEAYFSRIPLIILSADRPDYLVGTGANQTIYQKDLYGKNVRLYRDVGLPGGNISELQDILILAYKCSTGENNNAPPGPVHLNYPFDEPLLPEKSDKPNFSNYFIDNQKKGISDKIVMPILTPANKPLIILGPMDNNHMQGEIIQLAEQIKAPILADPLSQVRYGYENRLVLSNYDLFLRFIHLQPDLVIRFGRKPTSKILCNLLDKWNNVYLIDKWQQFNDNCPQFIQASVIEFCQWQVQKVKWQGENNWVTHLLNIEVKINEIICSEMGLHEGTIARECLDTLNEGSQIILGNSMPVRDVDMFTISSSKKIKIYGNRGASGIDGVVSTALGISAGAQNKSKTLLLIGDLSFFHDMNGLVASRYKFDLTIVVINNSGGGIFSFLPITVSGIKQFEEFWTTDMQLDIQKIADLYNCKYFCVSNNTQLHECIKDSFTQNGIKIIEIITDIKGNVRSHSEFLNRVEKSLAEL